jgi:two-component system cell cycle sensor histidine kinase PleC
MFSRDALLAVGTALAGLKDGLALFGADDCLIYCNQAYALLTGLDGDLIRPGIHFSDVMKLMAARGCFPEAVGREEAWLAQRLTVFRAPGEPAFDVRRPDGSWWRVEQQVLPDGSLFLQLRDVTSLRAAERAAIESEKRFRDFAETASDWFWETGPDHRFTNVSRRFEATGFAPEDLFGKMRPEFVADAGNDPEKWRQHKATLDRHEAFRDFEFAIQHPDGRRRYVSVTGKPVFDANGVFCGYRGGAREISDRVLASQRDTEARRAAETANRAKSVFLANMSHELRTPLNAVIGFASVLVAERFGPLGNAKYREYARDIHDSGTHLLEVINDVLDLSKVEAGKMQFVEVEVDLPELIGRAIRLVAGKASEKGLSIETDLSERLPGVLADELLMRQILVNLLSNAVKFTPEGGSVTVRCALHAEGDLTIEVTDSGIGIAAEHIPCLGTPFYQIEDRYARQFEGTGLGLALVKQMVEMHQGDLHFTSEIGVGTTVTVTFPGIRVIRSIGALLQPSASRG